MGFEGFFLETSDEGIEHLCSLFIRLSDCSVQDDFVKIMKSLPEPVSDEEINEGRDEEVAVLTEFQAYEWWLRSEADQN